MTKLLALLLFSWFFIFQLTAKDRILAQVISVEVQNMPIKNILKTIEEIGKVKFSYNPNIIDGNRKVSLSLKQKTIRQGLNIMFNHKVSLKEVGNHILILEKEPEAKSPKLPAKSYYLIKGQVTNKETKQPIPYTSVYDIDSRFSVLTDANGYFEMKIPTTLKTISLYYAKSGYRTNVKLITVTDRPFLDGSEALYEQLEDINKMPSPMVPKKVWIEIEDKTISGELFSMEASTHNENLKYLNQNRWAQLSLIPQLSVKAGKNYQGILYNHFSLNILGGYSKGLKGLEIGGIANVLKENGYGVQLGGVINLVGNNYQGLQMGGISNIVKANYIGLQFAGISNTVRQKFYGIQIAGIVNTVKDDFNGIQFAFAGNNNSGKFNGIQVGGFMNSVQNKMNGIQLSGFSSLAKSGFSGLQISGLINHTASTSYGMQISLIQNVALQKFVGAQITGFMNSAIAGANIFQMAGLLNIANKNNGIQIVGVVNYAKQNNGLQIGLINLSKTNKGLSLGLINFVWDGYHKIEVLANETTMANIRVKSGVKRFYNIYSVGKQFTGAQNLTTIGFGFGAVYNLSETFAISTDIEGIIAFNQHKEFAELAKFSPSFDIKLSDHFAFFVGPTLNVNYNLLSGNTLIIDEYSLYNDITDGNYLNMWIGGQFGLRF